MLISDDLSLEQQKETLNDKLKSRLYDHIVKECGFNELKQLNAIDWRQDGDIESTRLLVWKNDLLIQRHAVKKQINDSATIEQAQAAYLSFEFTRPPVEI